MEGGWHAISNQTWSPFRALGCLSSTNVQAKGCKIVYVAIHHHPGQEGKRNNYTMYPLPSAHRYGPRYTPPPLPPTDH